MAKVLVVNSSPRAAGYSRRLVQFFLEQLSARQTLSITHRDLVAMPCPTLSEDAVAAIRAADPTPEQRHAAVFSDVLIQELQSADLLVMGVPMHNWGVPAALKGWLDHVLRINYTFRYGPAGPEGLLNQKPAVVVTTRGGLYSAPERVAFDFQLPYLRQIFGTVGLNARFVVCEGTLRGEDIAQRAFAAASDELASHARDVLIAHPLRH